VFSIQLLDIPAWLLAKHTLPQVELGLSSWGELKTDSRKILISWTMHRVLTMSYNISSWG
jgi:hypothetical protein